jgi:hypothetical protein
VDSRFVLEPLAELLSMGMGSLVLWWIEDAGVSRTSVARGDREGMGGILAGP